MVLLIDNYDSFTFNLYQYLCELGAEVEVVRNDMATIDEIEAMDPDRVVVSPGPSRPENAGVSSRSFAGSRERNRCWACALGTNASRRVRGAVEGAGEIKHGKTSMVEHDDEGLFTGVPNPFEAIRYHSLAIMPDSLPDELKVTAWSDSGVIMGVRHESMPVEGVQFHPESILTTPGKRILQNFLDM